MSAGEQAGPEPLFPRAVTHREALDAAQDLIDHFFKNKARKNGGVLVSIPARADNTDLVLTDYIKQQMAKDAAAHDLLEALEALYLACEHEANASGGDFGPVIGPAAYAAQEVISRARGEQA